MKSEFQEKFKHSHARYTVEPNGVDAKLFNPRDKTEARRRLGIAENEHIALYIGRFFDWKGLEIIPEAIKYANATIEWYFVGGTKEDFVRITKKQPEPSMHFVGGVPQSEVVWWISAADVLLVLGTKRDRQSFYYTSPMKLFEYLLSERVIVASDTPAIREIVSEKEVWFYVPDSAEDIASKVHEAIISHDMMRERIAAATKLGKLYSWHSRAHRILQFIEEKIGHGHM